MAGRCAGVVYEPVGGVTVTAASVASHVLRSRFGERPNPIGDRSQVTAAQRPGPASNTQTERVASCNPRRGGIDLMWAAMRVKMVIAGAYPSGQSDRIEQEARADRAHS
jgi:hypothetical protein